MILIKNLLKIAIDNKKFLFSLIFFNRKFFIKSTFLRLSQNRVDKNQYVKNSLFLSISLGKFFGTIYICKYNDKNSHF